MHNINSSQSIPEAILQWVRMWAFHRFTSRTYQYLSEDIEKIIEHLFTTKAKESAMA